MNESLKKLMEAARSLAEVQSDFTGGALQEMTPYERGQTLECLEGMGRQVGALRGLAHPLATPIRGVGSFPFQGSPMEAKELFGMGLMAPGEIRDIMAGGAGQ